MKIILSLFCLLLVCEALIPEAGASASSRRRRRLRRERVEKMTKLCEAEKVKLKDTSWACPRDLETLLRQEFGHTYSTCINGEEKDVAINAQNDLINTHCLREAEQQNPVVAAKLEDERKNRAIALDLIITIVVSFIVLFLFGVAL